MPKQLPLSPKNVPPIAPSRRMNAIVVLAIAFLCFCLCYLGFSFLKAVFNNDGNDITSNIIWLCLLAVVVSFSCFRRRVRESSKPQTGYWAFFCLIAILLSLNFLQLVFPTLKIVPRHYTKIAALALSQPVYPTCKLTGSESTTTGGLGEQGQPEYNAYYNCPTTKIGVVYSNLFSKLQALGDKPQGFGSTPGDAIYSLINFTSGSYAISYNIYNRNDLLSSYKSPSALINTMTVSVVNNGQ